jgi:integrase
LKFELTMLCRRNRDGSQATQAGRLQVLRQVADELKALGFGRMGARSLKPKHVDALVQHWQVEGLTAGTRKNRMAVLRWWAEKAGKPAVIARDNTVYGIEVREFVSKGSKAIEATQEALARIEDDRIRLALRLQAAFGLRREEALKFRVSYADQGDHIRLRGSWCKGGRPRTVPVLTPKQRALLVEVRRVAGDGSLIPGHLRYVDQLQRFKFATSRAGISKTHGLRHYYAQWRYRSLTGWPATAAGGPGLRQLTPAQQAIDRRARLQISAELGHGREAITTVYLGR